MSGTKHANSAEEIVAYWNRNPIEYFFHISGPDLRVVIAEWTALRAENERLRAALTRISCTAAREDTSFAQPDPAFLAFIVRLVDAAVF